MQPVQSLVEEIKQETTKKEIRIITEADSFLISCLFDIERERVRVREKTHKKMM